MREKERKNYLFNLLYQFVAIAYPIILTPYTARIFGANGVGDYSYTVAINTLFTLILTCIGRYGFREISYTKGNKSEESRVFWEIFLLKSVALCIIILIYGYITFHSGRYKSLFLAQTISILYIFFDVGWYWQGLENFKITASISIVNRVLMLLAVFLFVKKAEDLTLYAFIISFVSLLGSLYMWLPLIKRLEKPHSVNIRRHIKPCFLLCIPFIIIELYSSVDKTMIEWITHNSFENGYYEQTIKITKMVMVVLTSMSLIKAPRHGALANEGKYDEIYKSMYDSFNFMLFLGFPITLGLCSVADHCVPIFLGCGYERVITLMYLYAPFMILHGFVDILANQYFIPIKQQNVYTIVVSISCIVNIILNVLLIAWKGAAGATVATVISEGVSCLLLFRLSNGIFSLRKMFKDNLKVICASLIMFFLSVLVKIIGVGSDGAIVILQICVGVISYAVILYALKYKLFLQVLNDILYKFKITVVKK